MSEKESERPKISRMDNTYALVNPDKVRYLIYHENHPENGEMIVYVDKDMDLDWECDNKAAKLLDEKNLMVPLRKIQNGVAALEPLAHNWPADLKLTTKRLLGEAVAAVLVGDIEGAEEGLSNAKAFFRTKSRQVSRFWTLQGCLLAGGVAALVGMVGLLARTYLIDLLGRTPFLLSLCFCAGCVGALLFVVMRLGKQPKVDSTAERHLHFLEAISRIVAGGIAGVLVGGMVKLGLILPVFGQTGEESLAMCAAAVIAGASERLAAGIVTKVENNEPISKENPNADN